MLTIRDWQPRRVIQTLSHYHCYQFLWWTWGPSFLELCLKQNEFKSHSASKVNSQDSEYFPEYYWPLESESHKLLETYGQFRVYAAWAFTMVVSKNSLWNKLLFWWPWQIRAVKDLSLIAQKRVFILNRWKKSFADIWWPAEFQGSLALTTVAPQMEQTISVLYPTDNHDLTLRTALQYFKMEWLLTYLDISWQGAQSGLKTSESHNHYFSTQIRLIQKRLQHYSNHSAVMQLHFNHVIEALRRIHEVVTNRQTYYLEYWRYSDLPLKWINARDKMPELFTIAEIDKHAIYTLLKQQERNILMAARTQYLISAEEIIEYCERFFQGQMNDTSQATIAAIEQCAEKIYEDYKHAYANQLHYVEEMAKVCQDAENWLAMLPAIALFLNESQAQYAYLQQDTITHGVAADELLIQLLLDYKMLLALYCQFLGLSSKLITLDRQEAQITSAIQIAASDLTFKQLMIKTQQWLAYYSSGEKHKIIEALQQKSDLLMPQREEEWVQGFWILLEQLSHQLKGQFQLQEIQRQKANSLQQHVDILQDRLTAEVAARQAAELQITIMQKLLPHLTKTPGLIQCFLKQCSTITKALSKEVIKGRYSIEAGVDAFVAAIRDKQVSIADRSAQQVMTDIQNLLCHNSAWDARPTL